MVSLSGTKSKYFFSRIRKKKMKSEQRLQESSLHGLRSRLMHLLPESHAWVHPVCIRSSGSCMGRASLSTSLSTTKDSPYMGKNLSSMITTIHWTYPQELPSTVLTSWLRILLTCLRNVSERHLKQSGTWLGARFCCAQVGAAVTSYKSPVWVPALKVGRGFRTEFPICHLTKWPQPS